MGINFVIFTYVQNAINPWYLLAMSIILIAFVWRLWPWFKQTKLYSFIRSLF